MFDFDNNCEFAMVQHDHWGYPYPLNKEETKAVVNERYRVTSIYFNSDEWCCDEKEASKFLVEKTEAWILSKIQEFDQAEIDLSLFAWLKMTNTEHTPAYVEHDVSKMYHWEFFDFSWVRGHPPSMIRTDYDSFFIPLTSSYNVSKLVAYKMRKLTKFISQRIEYFKCKCTMSISHFFFFFSFSAYM